jgi:hypothetical protein
MSLVNFKKTYMSTVDLKKRFMSPVDFMKCFMSPVIIVFLSPVTDKEGPMSPVAKYPLEALLDIISVYIEIIMFILPDDYWYIIDVSTKMLSMLYLS